MSEVLGAYAVGILLQVAACLGIELLGPGKRNGTAQEREERTKFALAFDRTQVFVSGAYLVSAAFLIHMPFAAQGPVAAGGVLSAAGIGIWLDKQTANQYDAKSLLGGLVTPLAAAMIVANLLLGCVAAAVFSIHGEGANPEPSTIEPSGHGNPS